MSTTDELVFNLRDQHDMLGPIALEAADAIETLTRERDEARKNLIAEWCKGCGTVSSDGHCHCNDWPDSPAECRDPMPFIRTWAEELRAELCASDARITKLEADKARLRDDLISIEEYWNRSRTDVAMIDALEYITATAREALDATP
jgi:hypothetical protein